MTSATKKKTAKTKPRPSTNNDILKKAMIEALTYSLGIVTSACNVVGISRNTHYTWLNEDPVYKASVESLSDLAIDFVESKLYEKIAGIEVQKGKEVYTVPPSDTAIIFYLKTKGKKRGYSEQDGFDSGKEITVNHIFVEPDDES